MIFAIVIIYSTNHLKMVSILLLLKFSFINIKITKYSLKSGGAMAPGPPGTCLWHIVS